MRRAGHKNAAQMHFLMVLRRALLAQVGGVARMLTGGMKPVNVSVFPQTV
jgi:hypothetical protein